MNQLREIWVSISMQLSILEIMTAVLCSYFFRDLLLSFLIANSFKMSERGSLSFKKFTPGIRQNRGVSSRKYSSSAIRSSLDVVSDKESSHLFASRLLWPTNFPCSLTISEFTLIASPPMHTIIYTIFE